MIKTMSISSSAAELPVWVSYWALVATCLVCSSDRDVLEFKRRMSSVVLDLWTWYGQSDAQYSAVDVKDDSGWMITQSVFNVFEVLDQ